MQAMSNTKEQEEAKREKAWDPKVEGIAETIAWMEANLPPEQKRNRLIPKQF